MTVPSPRMPRCYSHAVWHASCADCCDQRKAERLAALARLERARREAGAL